MENGLKWYIIKATYGREKLGAEYLTSKGIKAFSPTVTKIKEDDESDESVKEYSLPNLFFAQGTEQALKPLVERNPEADYLRFYCRYYNEGGKRRRQIITIPQTQMNSFLKICEAKDLDIRICNEVIHKFAKGEYVRVTAGPFEGVQGRMVSIYGKKRVGIVIANTLTVMTSYIPNAFWEKVEEE